MKKSSIFGSDGQREVNPDWFTGRVWMKVLSDGLGSSKQDMYHVHFEKGARTKLHRHDCSQVLIVTEGRGSLATYESDGVESDSFSIREISTTSLSAGDVVHVPENTLHAHGSTDATATFSHIAVNNLPCGVGEYVTVWYESDGDRVTGQI
jgi:quercetin dioxygenase-like cupin family protein